MDVMSDDGSSTPNTPIETGKPDLDGTAEANRRRSIWIALGAIAALLLLGGGLLVYASTQRATDAEDRIADLESQIASLTEDPGSGAEETPAPEPEPAEPQDTSDNSSDEAPSSDPPETQPDTDDQDLVFSAQIRDMWDPHGGTWEWLWIEVLPADAMGTQTFKLDPREVDITSPSLSPTGDETFGLLYDTWAFNDDHAGIDGWEWWVTVEDDWVLSMEEL
jgi:hypothetical protein